MIEELKAGAAAVSGLKAAFDLTKAVLDVKGAVEIEGKVFELQRVIIATQADALAAQMAQASLFAEKGQLEAKIADLEAWEREQDRYHLKEVGNGGFAYALKAEAQGSEPMHNLCARCFQHRRKSILQKFEYAVGRAETLRCHECSSEILVHGVIPMRKA